MKSNRLIEGKKLICTADKNEGNRFGQGDLVLLRHSVTPDGSNHLDRDARGIIIMEKREIFHNVIMFLV
jgi:3,4-dihydroxy-2-butanone 4-phosphate synthase